MKRSYLNTEFVSTNGHSHRDQEHKKELLHFVLIGALILIGGVWIWKALQINRIRKENQERVELLKDEANLMMYQTQKEGLRLMALPMGWALHGALVRGNLNDVNQYIETLVKEKNIQRLEVLNEKGIVAASTNKQLEGQPVSTPGNPTYRGSDSTQVFSVNDTTLVLTHPIFGYARKLGTLVITYRLRPALHP